MKTLQRPVLTTAVYGLVCGISFIPLNMAMNGFFYRPGAECLALWLFTAGYAVLLCRWNRQKLLPAAFPLLFLLLTSFLVYSISAFFLLALAVVGWTRSGVCREECGMTRLAVELLLCLAGGVMAALFTPASVLAWVAAIWLFFLLQALYFAVFEINAAPPHSSYAPEPDPFEQASRRAEDILATVELI